MKVRRAFLLLWIGGAATALYLYVARRGWLQAQLASILTAPPAAAAALYLLLGSLRGFTLIPSTALVLVALPFFPPAILLMLTLAGIVVSSTSIYFCSSALGFDRVFERRHGTDIAHVKTVLAKHEVAIIIGWSFFPLVPTDLICYVCGVMRVNFWRFIVSVTLGEGAICAAYIYGGDQFLRWLQLR